MQYIDDTLPETFADPNVSDFLHLRGANSMQSPLAVLPGRQEKPAVAFVGDERTGPFQAQPGQYSISLSGWERLRITQDQILAVARDGSTGADHRRRRQRDGHRRGNGSHNLRGHHTH